jgi:hypothetical protein
MVMKDYQIRTKVVIQNTFNIKSESEEQALKSIQNIVKNGNIFYYDLKNNGKKTIQYQAYERKNNKLKKGKIKDKLYDL